MWSGGSAQGSPPTLGGAIIWVWLKIKAGQTAGFGFHVSTYQGKPFWYRFVEPPPFLQVTLSW